MLDTILLKLDSIKERYLFLEKELSNSEIVNNHQLYANYSKEYSNIKNIVSNASHRQLLHAYKLGFEHPTSKEKHIYKTDLPQDMAKINEIL